MQELSIDVNSVKATLDAIGAFFKDIFGTLSVYANKGSLSEHVYLIVILVYIVLLLGLVFFNKEDRKTTYLYFIYFSLTFMVLESSSLVIGKLYGNHQIQVGYAPSEVRSLVASRLPEHNLKIKYSTEPAFDGMPEEWLEVLVTSDLNLINIPDKHAVLCDAAPLYQLANNLDLKTSDIRRAFVSASKLNIEHHISYYLKTIGDTSEPGFVDAIKLFNNKDSKGAIDKFAAISRDHPESFEAQYNLGISYIYQQKYQNAGEKLEHAIALLQQTSPPPSQGNKVELAYGWVSYALGKYEQAILALENVSDEDSSVRGKSLYNLSIVYHTLGDRKKSENYATRASNEYGHGAANISVSVAETQFAIDESLERERFLKTNIKNNNLIGLDESSEFIDPKFYLAVWPNKNKNKLKLLAGYGHLEWFFDFVPSKDGYSFNSWLLQYKKTTSSTLSKLPEWLSDTTEPPWESQLEFDQDKAKPSGKYKELVDFLEETMDQQTSFIAERAEKAIPLITDTLTDSQIKTFNSNLNRLIYDSRDQPNRLGIWMVTDYIHFKGEGTLDSEVYDGFGWGLKQVILEMEQYKNEAPVSAFVLAAKKVLNQRIEHSPGKTDSKYRKEWFKRLDSYLNPKFIASA